MAREYGKNWFSMWTDEDFCTGLVFDKLFYQVLIGQSGMNDAGIVPINFRKWRKALRDGDVMPSERDVKASLVRQERRRYVFTDEDTGEVLIRSHIRRDQIWRQPAVMVSALRDLASCESAKFACVMSAELDRIELPEVKGDTKQADRLRDSLKRTNEAARMRLETLCEGLVEPLPEPFTEDFPEGLPEPFRRPGKTEPLQEPFQGGSEEPPVVVEVEVKSPSVVGYVERAQARNAATDQAAANRHPDGPPPPHCPKHMPDGTAADCGGCGAHRKRRERWDAEHANDASTVRALFWATVRAAKCCDPNGQVDDPSRPNAISRCPNHDWSVLDA